MGPPSEKHDCDWKEYARHLEGENEALAKSNAQLIQKNENLKHDLGVQKKHRFGKRSEKLPASKDQEKKRELTKEEKAERRRKAKEKRKTNRGSRANLPVKEEKHTVSEARKVCKFCGENAVFTDVTNGDRETEILEQTIASLERIRHRIQKLRCHCGKTFIQAKPPERVFPLCEYGPRFVASIIVAKVLDSMPFYRQRKAHFRNKLYINDNVLGSLFHKAGHKFLPIYDLLKKQISSAWLIMADETVLKYLNPAGEATGQANIGYVWCFLAPERDQVVFLYDSSRAAKIPESLLKDTSGILVCDGYAGYNVVVNSYDRERAGCLAHARRKFVDLLGSDADLMAPILDKFKVIYGVEREMANEGLLGSKDHLEARQNKSLDALNQIKELCENRPPELLPGSPVAKAMNYFLNQWPHLKTFTENVRIPVDNNFCERTLRIVALLRKNANFVGNQKSGQRTMILLSLAQSCVLNGINPLEYFADVLMRMNDPPTDLAELLPGNWKPPPEEKTPPTS
jgi:transposase